MIDEPPVMMELRYVGGPIDNTIERRVVAPRLGEFVYRSPTSGLYAKYVWDGSAFVFEELTP